MELSRSAAEDRRAGHGASGRAGMPRAGAAAGSAPPLHITRTPTRSPGRRARLQTSGSAAGSPGGRPAACTAYSKQPGTSRPHHAGHKFGLRRAVCRCRLEHAARALAHHRQPHGGPPRGAPALQEHRGGLRGGDAHPVEMGGLLSQHLRVWVWVGGGLVYVGVSVCWCVCVCVGGGGGGGGVRGHIQRPEVKVGVPRRPGRGRGAARQRSAAPLCAAAALPRGSGGRAERLPQAWKPHPRAPPPRCDGGQPSGIEATPPAAAAPWAADVGRAPPPSPPWGAPSRRCPAPPAPCAACRSCPAPASAPPARRPRRRRPQPAQRARTRRGAGGGAREQQHAARCWRGLHAVGLMHC